MPEGARATDTRPQVWGGNTGACWLNNADISQVLLQVPVVATMKHMAPTSMRVRARALSRLMQRTQRAHAPMRTRASPHCTHRPGGCECRHMGEG